MPSRDLFFKSLLAFGIVWVPFSYYVNKLETSHNSLSGQVAHKSTISTADALSGYTENILSLPDDLSRSTVYADEAIKVVQASSLPTQDEGWLLTTYLQHNMAKFASLPQSWILWLLSDHEKKATFNQMWISSRNFEQGDRVCGDYVVIYRQADQIEMKMSMGEPETSAYIEGRLVVSINIDKGHDEATFRTRTIMWRRQDSTRLMPLERTIPKWLHELASWGLIEQGVQHLIQLKEMENSRPAS